MQTIRKLLVPVAIRRIDAARRGNENDARGTIDLGEILKLRDRDLSSISDSQFCDVSGDKRSNLPCGQTCN